MNYQIKSQGADAPDYVPGFSAIFSQFDEVVTGAGENEKEAYNDAVDQIYDIEDRADELKLPIRPKGILASRTAPDGMYYYVSIFYTLKPE